MNRTYFNFKMKFAQNSGIEYLLEYPFVPSAKLHKLLSTSIVGPKFETRSSFPNIIFKSSVLFLLCIPNFIKIRLYLKLVTKSA